MSRGDLGGRLIGRALDAACRRLYRVYDAGLEHVPERGPAVVVFSHRRDADGPLVGNRMLGRGLLGRNPLPRTMARDDLFRPGFLAAYLRGWPGWLRRPLGRLRLAPLLRLAGARPIRRIEERTLDEVLGDVLAELGNLPLDQVLQPLWLRQFTALGDGTPPADVEAARDRRYEEILLRPRGLTALTPTSLRAVTTAQRRTVARQLRGFAAHLEGGGTLLLAPEGVVSEDGSLGRLRSALTALLDGVPSTRVVPAAVTYDFMSRHRVRAFLRFGPPLTGLAALEPEVATARVRRGLLACWTVTATQLAGSALHQHATRAQPVTVGEVEREVAEAMARWAAAGMAVAGDIRRAATRKRRVADLLRWAERAGLVERRGTLVWPLADAAAPATWRSPRGSLAYAANELAALSELLGPTPPMQSGSALENLEKTAH